MFHGDPEALRASPPPGSPPPTGPGTHAGAVSVPAELAVLQTAVILGCPDCINAQADLLAKAGTSRTAFCEALQKSCDAVGPSAMIHAAQAMDRFAGSAA